ncbi:uncharacterized protein BJ212DRAFT_1291627, partial [Suillus subaureus]
QEYLDFVFCFAGVTTINALIISALNCFVENVFMYDMGIWAALQALFDQDKHALNNTLSCCCTQNIGL